MKVPFRYQITDSDCVPTTFINAMQFLYERDEIPQAVIKTIIAASQNIVSAYNEIGKEGTTRFAIEYILEFIESYRTDNFACAYEYILDDKVHLGPNNKIISCLNNGGTALLCVCTDNTDVNTHYILALGQDFDKSKLLFFDPLYRDRKFYGETSDTVEWLGINYIDKTTKRFPGQNPNLKVSRERLNSYKCQKYSMGPNNIRECCLLWRL